MRSKLPQAKQFQDWVYRVLSKIRAHGGYMSPHPYLKQVVDIIPVHLRGTFSNMRGKISEQQQMIENLNRQLEEQQGKVAFYDLAMDSSNVVPITVIAKNFGMTANYLHSILSNAEIIYRVGDTWVLHKDYQNQGFTASKSRVTLTDIDGTVHENCEIATYWTERGRAFIYNNLMARGYKPLYLES
jgi:phage antirepressor YoqD-like protein